MKKPTQNSAIIAKLQGWAQQAWATPHLWFLLFSLTCGTAFTFVNVPYQVPDELGHSARAYQISTGQLTATKTALLAGGFVPASLGEVGLRATHQLPGSPWDVPLNPDKKVFEGFPNTVMNSPMVYAPQALGMAIGRTVNAPALAIFYLGRLGNVIAYSLLFYLAIRLMPFGKWALVAVGLLPMHILLAGSNSADPVSTGMLALFIATIFWLRTSTILLTRRQWIILLAVVAGMSLTKQPLPLLLVLLLFIPWSRFGATISRRFIGLGVCVITAAIIGGGWLLWAKTSYTPYGPVGIAVSPADQMQFVLTHTLSFIKAATLTYLTNASDTFLKQYVLSIGPLEAWFPLWASYAYSIFLGFLFWGIRGTQAVLANWQRLVLGIGLAAILGVIALILYISWTQVAWPRVEGFQARYLTPLLILVIPLVAPKAKKASDGILPAWALRVIPAGFLACALVAAQVHFMIRF